MFFVEIIVPTSPAVKMDLSVTNVQTDMGQKGQHVGQCPSSKSPTCLLYQDHLDFNLKYDTALC